MFKYSYFFLNCSEKIFFQKAVKIQYGLSVFLFVTLILLTLISLAHVVSVMGCHPFRENVVGGFLWFEFIFGGCKKYFRQLRFPCRERVSRHEIMSCGAQRRQTSSQLNHSTSNPSVTQHLLG